MDINLASAADHLFRRLLCALDGVQDGALDAFASVVRYQMGRHHRRAHCSVGVVDRQHRCDQ